MLTPKGILHYHKMLKLGAALCLIPYSWDPKTCRLSRGSRTTLKVIKFHSLMLFFVMVFSTIRLYQSIHKDPSEFPLFVKVLNFVWIFAATLTNVIFYQFHVLR